GLSNPPMTRTTVCFCSIDTRQYPCRADSATTSRARPHSTRLQAERVRQEITDRRHVADEPHVRAPEMQRVPRRLEREPEICVLAHVEHHLMRSARRRARHG